MQKNIEIKNGLRNTTQEIYLNSSPLIEMAKNLGWNNTKISEAAKVNVKTARNWVNKNTRISMKNADNLCIALGTSLEIVYPYA